MAQNGIHADNTPYCINTVRGVVFRIKKDLHDTKLHRHSHQPECAALVKILTSLKGKKSFNRNHVYLKTTRLDHDRNRTTTCTRQSNLTFNVSSDPHATCDNEEKYSRQLFVSFQGYLHRFDLSSTPEHP